MKRKLSAFLMILLLVGIVLTLYTVISRSNSSLSPAVNNPQPSIVQKQNINNPLPASSLFVPYWSLGNAITDEYDRYYYFGIAATKDGIDIAEAGYKNMQKFLNTVPRGKEKYLVVRMVNSDVNSVVLRDGQMQRKIIEDSIFIMQQYGFDGIVLDFEITALAFESVIKEISSFVGLFTASAKQSSVPFLITVYGDTFYRLRPYDIKTLSKEVDGIIIMTYDFHKARGNPGPNFPLSGKSLYGYDLKTMVDDFTNILPREKISVALGLFGYDWILDDTNKGVGTAKALTLNQIQQQFLQKCTEKNCIIRRDTTSSETVITYTDKDGKNHSVWFEDLQSLEEKKEYLKSQGINSITLWAHSYF